jgi:hypothetical protein
MARTGRPTTPRGTAELALCDVDDSCQEIAVALRELEHLKRRLQKAYIHGARGYRRAVIVSDVLGPWDGTMRRATDSMVAMMQHQVEAETAAWAPGQVAA